MMTEGKMMTRRLCSLCLLLVVIVGVLTTVILFVPGYMSPDSVAQLAQGRTGSYNDWQPPVMSWLWGRLDRVVPGPLGMLVFHNLLFWSGLGLWVALVAPRWNISVKCLMLLVIGFFPSIFLLLSTIWKDVGMAAAFLFASALLLYAERRRSLAALLLSLPALWYGVAVRHNAAIAALPLTIYAGFIGFMLIAPSPARTNWQRKAAIVILGFGLLMLMLALNTIASNRLTKNLSSFPIQQILIHDVVAISIETNTDLLPEYLKSGPQQPSVRDLEKIYTPDGVVPLFCCDSTVTRLMLTEDPGNITSLERVWAKAVLSAPGIYLTHRLRVFESQFGIARSLVCYPFHYGIEPNNLGISYQERPFTSKMFAGIINVQDSFLFRGWIYAAMNAVLLIGTILGRRRLAFNRSVILAVSASGLIYAVSYVLTSTSCDFRMEYWTVVAALVSSLAMVAALFPGRQPAGRPTR
jgi:hypothetical protein